MGEPVATIIGDLVDSRLAKDRTKLQRAMVDVFAALGTTRSGFNWVQAPVPTVGDEFQAVVHGLRRAASATLRIRLELLKATGVDCRFGIGWGAIDVFDRVARPISQDGAGWWAARSAIEETEGMAARARTGYVRTRVCAAEPVHTPIGRIDQALNAYLLTRDAMVDEMKPPTRNYLLGLLRGWSQGRIAEEEGVTQSNVSQALSRSRAYALLEAENELGGSGIW